MGWSISTPHYCWWYLLLRNNPWGLIRSFDVGERAFYQAGCSRKRVRGARTREVATETIRW